MRGPERTWTASCLTTPKILRETKGRISGPNGAAFQLGMKRSTLLDRMKKLGIDAREVKTNLACETQVIY
jgi:hypothetical protein